MKKKAIFIKFGNVYVNQADISFARKVDVEVTSRGPALPPKPPKEKSAIEKVGDGVSILAGFVFGGLEGGLLSMVDESADSEPKPQVVKLSVPALKINFKNGKTQTIVPFPVIYDSGYEHTFATTNNSPIKEYAQSYVSQHRRQLNSWLSQLK